MNGSAPRRPPLGPAEIVALAASCGLAVSLALHDLGAKSLWIDEATTWATASQHGSLFWHWAAHDGGNMLGYYAVVHVVIGVFGSSPVVIRAPSALAYAGLVPTSFFLMRRLFGRRAAVMSAFLVPASSSLVLWGQQARGFLPAAFGVTAAALALVVAVQERVRWAWAAFALAAVFALYMDLLTGLVILGFLGALAMLPPGCVPRRRLLAAALAVGAAGVPLLLVALHRGTDQLDWIPRPTWPVVRRFLRFFVSAPGNNAVAILVGGAVVIAGVAAMVTAVRRARSFEAFASGLLVLWVLLPLLVLTGVTTVHPVLWDRYVLVLAPAVAMLVALLCSRIRPVLLGWGAGAALMALHLWTLDAIVPYDEDWIGATSYVLSESQPQDCVAFFVADGFPAFAYEELRLGAGQPPRSVLPAARYSDKTPFVLDPEIFPKDRLASVTAQCPRLWLVQTHQYGQPPESGAPPYRVKVYRDRAELLSELSGPYKVVDEQAFTYVEVRLYTTRSGSRAGT